MNLETTGPHWLGIAFAIGFLAWEAWRLLLARASEHWKTTTGRVLEAYMDETRDSDGDVQHEARVRYVYQVGSARFESRRLSYAGIGFGYREQLAMLSGVVRGREVDVWYDPRNPSRSVLVPGSNGGNVAGIVLALVILGIAIGTAL